MNAESLSHTMLTQSVSNPSVWASMNSWFTPTVFFVLLNLMVGTILFNSKLLIQKQTSQQQEQEDQDANFQNDHHTPKLTRSPSVLKRLKSLNFRNFRSHEAAVIKQETLDEETQKQTMHEENVKAQAQAQAQFILEQTHEDESPLSETDDESLSEEDEEPQSLDMVYSQLGHKFTDGNFSRTTSETKPASGQVPAKLPTKMKKSASMKSPFAHFEESDIVEIRRPATVREKKSSELDEEVDAKADDFINKFKQQLKLQRMNSIIRYKEDMGLHSEKN